MGKDWRSEGLDPDYRFSLANERTFLAWIRTALAISAAAVVLHQFTGAKASLDFSLLSPLLAAWAALLAATSYVRWRAYEKAMRLGRALPVGFGFVPVLMSVCLVSAAVVVWTLVS